MKQREKRALVNGLLVGTILGIAMSAILYYAMQNPAVWIFAPMASVIGGAQGYMAARSE